MTLVGCYGTEERLTNCSYHKFEYSTSSYIPSTSMDVSISCDTLEVAVTRASNEARASLSISVILAVGAVVTVLIIVLIVQRRKKNAKR